MKTCPHCVTVAGNGSSWTEGHRWRSRSHWCRLCGRNARPRGWATLQQDGRRLLLGPTRDAQWAPRGRRRVAPGDLAFARLQVLLVLPKFAWKTASSSRRGPVSLTTGCGGCGNRAPGPALPGGTTAPLSCSAGSVSASLTAVPPARTPPLPRLALAAGFSLRAAETLIILFWTEDQVSAEAGPKVCRNLPNT